jgi:hypothetical protein
MKEKLDFFEISKSSLSQDKGSAYNQERRKAGFVIVNRPDDEGALEGDHLSAAHVAWSQSRNIPRPILRQPLLDTDDSSAGKATWTEHAALRLHVIQEHIPGYDDISEPSVGQVVREKARIPEGRC